MDAVGEICCPFSIQLQGHFQCAFGFEAELNGREQVPEDLHDSVLREPEVQSEHSLQLEGNCHWHEKRPPVLDASGDECPGRLELRTIVLYDIALEDVCIESRHGSESTPGIHLFDPDALPLRRLEHASHVEDGLGLGAHDDGPVRHC